MRMLLKLIGLSHLQQRILFLYFLLFFMIIAVVGISSYVPSQSALLKSFTKENSFFELGTVLLSLVLAIYAVHLLIKHSVLKKFAPGHAILVVLAAVGGFLVAGEEISWGQHIFGFSSGEYFREHNLQKETNLHNFIAGRYFTGFINTTVYTFFIFAPLLHRHFPEFLLRWPKLSGWLIPMLPSMHVSLMMCFSATLHPYFLSTSVGDTLALILGLLLVVSLMARDKRYAKPEYMVHWLLVVGAMIFFMLNTHVFSFYNMQAEIREFIVIFAGVVWFYQWTKNLLRSDGKVEA